MSKPVIISCAVTGSAPTADKNPAVPVTPDEIALSAIDAGDAGAAIVHVHVRDPETKRGSMDLNLYRRVFERIRKERPGLIVNLTTGAGALFTADDVRNTSPEQARLSSPADRVRHILALQPEICSLDVATMNFGDRMFLNSVADVTAMAGAMEEAGTLPELEAFDIGHMELIRHLIATGVLKQRPWIQLCLGILGGAPATPDSMMSLVRMLPQGANWSAFGIGSSEFPMVAQAVLLGGHVRVGLEDNLYLERGVLAESNAVLVDKAASITRMLGRRPATSDEAREILGLA